MFGGHCKKEGGDSQGLEEPEGLMAQSRTEGLCKEGMA